MCDLMIEFRNIPSDVLGDMLQDAARVAQFPQASRARQQAVRTAPDLVRELERRGVFIPEVVRGLAQEGRELQVRASFRRRLHDVGRQMGELIESAESRTEAEYLDDFIGGWKVYNDLRGVELAGDGKR